MKNLKKMLSLLLCLVMIAGLVPTTAAAITDESAIEIVDITVVKDWNVPEEGVTLPDYIEVYLTANGERVGESVVTLSEETGWRYTWEGMPKEDSDHIPIAYSVGEVPVEGYETIVVEPEENETGIRINIINTYIPEEVPETMDITVVKEWDVPEGILLPDAIQVYLTANGEPVGDATVTLSEENDWRYTWEGMQKEDSDHIEIAYSVGEVGIEGYESSVGDPMVTDNGIEIAIVNSYIPEEVPATMDITVVKEWDVPEDGVTLPDYIEVYLTANGEPVGEAPVVLSEETDWRYTWEGMQKEDSDHIPIVYSVSEVPVEGYETIVAEPEENDNGIRINIINTYVEPEIKTATIVVKKTDEDGNPLAGAKFILRSEGSEYEAISDASGLVTFADVVPDYYTLTETEAPAGYVLSDETWNFKVNEDGTVNGFSQALPNGYAYKNEQPLVIANEAEEVPVVEYTVTYVAGGGTGTMTPDMVVSGSEYTIRANGFTAPAGKQFKCWKIGAKEYKAGDKITVDADVTITAVWKNKPGTDSDLDYVPQTGDSSGTMLWTALGLMSAMALAGIELFRKRSVR